MSGQPPPIGNRVGDEGEGFVEQVCNAPLGKDFLFRGQKYRQGKNEIELSDLFFLLDDTAVLMEVKTANRIERPSRTEEEWTDYANSRLRVALDQIQRGATAIRTGLVKCVRNERQGRVRVDPSRIKHYYGVAVIDHPPLAKVGRGPVLDADGCSVSVLTTTHSELSEILRELSTAGDLIDYLQAREAFFAKHMMIGITELDVLAWYKSNPEKFLADTQSHDTVIIGEGTWDGYAERKERLKREVLDKPSYLVDSIIDRLHECRSTTPPHIEAARAATRQAADTGTRYIEIAAELARIRRINRRVIGDELIVRSQDCNKSDRDRWVATCPHKRAGAPCVFLVSRRSREERVQVLQLRTMALLVRTNARRVIGIATEPVGGDGFSVDAVMIAGDAATFRARMSPAMKQYMDEQFGPERDPGVNEFGGTLPPDVGGGEANHAARP